MILIYDLSEKNENDEMMKKEEISSAEEDILWYTMSEWTGEVNTIRHHFDMKEGT